MILRVFEAWPRSPKQRMDLSGDGCQRGKSGGVTGLPTGSDSLPGGLQQIDGGLNIFDSLRRLRLLQNPVVFFLHGFHVGVASDRAEMIKLPPRTRCHVEKPRNESYWAARMPPRGYVTTRVRERVARLDEYVEWGFGAHKRGEKGIMIALCRIMLFPMIAVTLRHGHVTRKVRT